LFTASGGTPPYTFLGVVIDPLPGNVGYTDHGDGTATVYVDGCVADGFRFGLVVHDAEGATASAAITFGSQPTGWAKTYGGIWGDLGQSPELLEVTDDGGCIFAADTNFGAGQYDIWVVKLDAEGNVEWEKAYGGEKDDYPHCIQKTNDGGYIVAGRSSTFRTGESKWDLLILKLTSAGAIEWQKSYGGDDSDWMPVVRQTDDDGYIVGASTGSFGMGGSCGPYVTCHDVWLVKLTSSGAVEWEKTYGGADSEYLRSVDVTDDGGYVFVADTQSFGMGDRDFWVVKVDGSGNVAWQKTYGGLGSEAPSSIYQVDGGYFVGGVTTSAGAGESDLWVLKLDQAGEPLWQKTYGGADNEYDGILHVTSDGGCILFAETANSFGGDSYDLIAIKLSITGETEWQKLYNTSDESLSSDRATTIRQTGSGYFVLAFTNSVQQYMGVDQGDDVLVLRLDSNGAVGCGIDRDIEATVTDTSVAGVFTESAVTEPTANVADTDVIVTDSSASVYSLCGTTPPPGS